MVNLKHKVEDLIGLKFGRLTVLYQGAGRGKSRPQRTLVCLCDCGAKKEIALSAIVGGLTLSCGCLCAEKGGSVVRHGLTKSPTWNCWVNLKQRCTNPDHKSFKDYGGRGITYCDRWESFDNFLEDMGIKPDGFQIDRINNELGYFKENCRWVSPKDNSNNRRSSRFITFKGETKTLVVWAAEFGLRPEAISYRLKAGWSIEDALTKPLIVGREVPCSKI